jgi:hypothetical protein
MFKEGDKVQWTSQANGGVKTKTGVVVQVVEPGKRPDRNRFPALYRDSGVGFGRDHESYVVRVDNKIYWPRVKDLRTGAV